MTSTAKATPATALAVPVKPFSIQLIGPAYPIFQELCAHVRNGYVINKDAPFELFQNGNAMFSLILGNPDEVAIASAKESTESSVAAQERQYRNDVEAAAKLFVEQQRREEIEKQVAAEVADHKRKIKELEKQAEAALAKLH